MIIVWHDQSAHGNKIIIYDERKLNSLLLMGKYISRLICCLYKILKSKHDNCSKFYSWAISFMQGYHLFFISYLT